MLYAEQMSVIMTFQDECMHYDGSEIFAFCSENKVVFIGAAFAFIVKKNILT